ncbi:MAG: hypothetical protein DRN91_08530 [Candidatus Alkanophagales archaeon]|nr:MAG: hypothetical protein DRN91_08530 [Candidatus Alkanophagales archaeon]
MYRTLAESSHTGILILQEGRVVYSNAKLSEMVGYSREELNELDPFSIVHPDFREMVVSRYRAREAGEDVPEDYEIKAITKDGRERWFNVLSTRISFRGKPAVLVNLADVTDIKESEERLKKLNTILSVINEVGRILTHERSIDLNQIQFIRHSRFGFSSIYGYLRV